MVEAPPYKPCAPSFFILLWWSESAGTSFCGFPDLKKRRKCKKRLPGLPRAVFFVSVAFPQGRHAPACRRTLATTKPNLERERGLQARLLQPSRTENAKVVCNPFREGTPPRAGARLLPPSRTQNAKVVCNPFREGTPPRAGARLLPPSRTENAKEVCKRACYNQAEFRTEKRFATPSRKARPRVPAHACSRQAELGTQKKVCKRASLRLFFRRRFL